MSEILDEYERDNVRKKQQNYIIVKSVGLFVLVVLFGIYVGDMLFGKSSLDVLLSLKVDKEELQKKVLTLKKENARLHKDHLGLVQLTQETQ